MPVYNCRECKELMDPTESVSCPSCNEKKPLNCSKCSEPINHHDIFGIQKLRTKKPLLCNSCGHDNEVVKCGLCKLSLVRSKGISLTPVEGANVYHKECLDKRREVISTANKAAPIAAVLGGVLTVMVKGTTAFGVILLLLISAGLFVGLKMLAKIIEPR